MAVAGHAGGRRRPAKLLKAAEVYRAAVIGLVDHDADSDGDGQTGRARKQPRVKQHGCLR